MRWHDFSVPVPGYGGSESNLPWSDQDRHVLSKNQTVLLRPQAK
jgi:hypothetical protein